MGNYSDRMLDDIYNKNNGYCVFCGTKLSRQNYGKPCAKGGWEVEHGRPASRGGVDDLRNLNPACAFCNREKGAQTSSEFKRRIEREYGSWDAFHRAMRRKYCQ